MPTVSVEVELAVDEPFLKYVVALTESILPGARVTVFVMRPPGTSDVTVTSFSLMTVVV